MTNQRLLAIGCLVLVLIGIALVFLLWSGGEESRRESIPPQSSLKQTSSLARPLKTSKVPVPDLGVSHYSTSGSYPRVSGRGLDLTAVNAALASTAQTDERAYRRVATEWVRSAWDPIRYRGVYESNFQRRTIVANTALVSTMYPTLQLFPGGNDGSGWLSTTVLVPSGRAVTLADLFGSDWLNVVSEQTHHQVENMEYCQPRGKLDGRWYDKGLAPLARNYEFFALTAKGVDIGLGHGQIGAAACGSRRVNLPWAALEGVLTEDGQVLADYAGGTF